MPIPQMVWGSRKCLRITLEDSPGDFDSSAPITSAWIRLDEDSSFDPFVNPEIFTIRSADGLGEVVQAGSNRTSVGGTISTPFYPSQAATILSLVAELVTSGTPVVYSKKTFTCDYFDGVRWRRYLGCHVTKAGLAFEAAQGYGRWTLPFVAWKIDATDPTVTEAVVTDFPTELPYSLQHSEGELKIGSSTARVGYSSWKGEWDNKIVVKPMESKWPIVQYAGRDISYMSNLFYKSGEVDRAAWENVTTQANNKIKFVRTGSAAVTLDFNANCHLSGYKNSHPLNDLAMVDLTIMAKIDPAATPIASFSYSVVAP